MEDELKSVLAFILDLLRDYGLDDFYLELSTRGDSDKFIGSDEEWESATNTLRDGRRGIRPRAGARPGRRRVLRPEDLRPGARRDRPDLADVDRPARLQPAQAVRPRVPGGRRQPAAADHDPPGAVRLDRAVHGRADRALRRRDAAVAGAGPGGGHPDRRRARALPGPRSPSGWRRAASGSRSTTATTGCRRRSAPPRSRRSRSCCWPGDDDVAAGAVSFRYRTGAQKNGVPVAEAIDEIVGRGRVPRPGLTAGLPRTKTPAAHGVWRRGARLPDSSGSWPPQARTLAGVDEVGRAPGRGRSWCARRSSRPGFPDPPAG